MPGEWYYAAMVYDAPSFKLYVTTVSHYQICQSGGEAPSCLPAAEGVQYGERKMIYFYITITKKLLLLLLWLFYLRLIYL